MQLISLLAAMLVGILKIEPAICYGNAARAAAKRKPKGSGNNAVNRVNTADNKTITGSIVCLINWFRYYPQAKTMLS